MCSCIFRLASIDCFLAFSDWPDYTSTDSDDSEVEHIIGGAHQYEGTTDAHSVPAPPQTHDKINHEPHWNATGPASDPTAQKIMHLLSEIGSAVHMDFSDGYGGREVLNCSHCSGQVINL